VLQPPTWGVPILVAFYDMHGLQWDYSFPQSPQGEPSDHPKNISWRVQIMKLHILQSSPASRHFLPARSRYSPQQPVLRYSPCSTLSVIDPSFTTVQNKYNTKINRLLPQYLIWHHAHNDLMHLVSSPHAIIAVCAVVASLFAWTSVQQYQVG
jgi:hypothetical protein